MSKLHRLRDYTRTGYVYGCRCDLCRAAEKTYQGSLDRTKYNEVKRVYSSSPAQRAKRQEWADSHRKLMNAYKIACFEKRRAQKLNAEINDFTRWDWLELINQYGCCAYCGNTQVVLTQDHKIPLARNGNHTKQNIVPACQSCNSKKGTRLLTEWKR